MSFGDDTLDPMNIKDATADKPDQASAVEPGAVDLDDLVEKMRALTPDGPAGGNIRSLWQEATVAVEALRERVVELDETSKYWMNEATVGKDGAGARITWKDRAKAAEARGVDSYAAGLEAAELEAIRVRDGYRRFSLRVTCEKIVQAIRALGKEEG